MTIKVAVVGALGRMGRTVCTAVEGAPDMELVARLDVGDEITERTLAGADVAVEFTVPATTEANVHALLKAGVDVVVGTTGWTDEALEGVRAAAEATSHSVIIAPNYALSAVLAMSFAEKAATYFESVEVIELHHPDKVGGIGQVAVMQVQFAVVDVRVLIQVVYAVSIKKRGTPFDAVHLVAFVEQKFRKISAVLSGNAGNKGAFH